MALSRFSAIALTSVLLAAPLLAGCNSSKSAAKDVSITACTADPGGGRPNASGTIDNHSSKASSYALEITFYDSAGNQVSEGAATLGKVESGATAKFTSEGLTDAKGPVTCKVASVTRTIAP
jgi:predicted small secreted protein